MDARKYAVSYLNAGPRTEKQVRDYLRKKGCGWEETEEAVKELKDYGYIDDENYCRMYFEYAFDRKRGIERIKRELREKGVSSEIIEMALESAEDVPDQYEEAKALALQAAAGTDIGGLSFEERRRLAARAGRRLAYRGFSQDIVYRVIKEIYGRTV